MRTKNLFNKALRVIFENGGGSKQLTESWLRLFNAAREIDRLRDELVGRSGEAAKRMQDYADSVAEGNRCLHLLPDVQRIAIDEAFLSAKEEAFWDTLAVYADEQFAKDVRKQVQKEAA